jgi:hypothetical protein
MSERPRFTIEVEPMDDTPHAGRRLARIVKTLGRQFGFKCVAVGEIADEQAQDLQQASPGAKGPTA